MSSANVPQEPNHHRPENVFIAVIHGSDFTRGCITHAIAAEFGPDCVLGLRSAEDVKRLTQSQLSLVILVCGKRSLNDDRLVAEIEFLNRAAVGVPVVLLSDDCNISPTEAIACGLSGVIARSDTLEMGVAALKLILAGGSYYARTETSARAQSPRPEYLQPKALCLRQSAASLANTPDLLAAELPAARALFLTEREAQVLGWLQQGLPNKAIANHLRLSENTVKVHVRHIMRKLKAKNRTEVVLRAQRFSTSFGSEQEITGRFASERDSAPVSAGNPISPG